MSQSSIENRLANLELQVTKLHEELSSIRRAGKDWRRAIGAFTDDQGMQQLLTDAMRLRESDRNGACSENRR